jgi:hypothetical protein
LRYINFNTIPPAFSLFHISLIQTTFALLRFKTKNENERKEGKRKRKS